MFLLLVFCFIVAPIYTNSKEYRSDYEYNSKTDAFYKMHIESLSRYNAKKVCESEGGNFIMPGIVEDIIQAHGMFKLYPDLGNYIWVEDDGRQHESAEETTIIDLEPNIPDLRVTPWNKPCDVITREAEIETYNCDRTLPFICKVEAKNAYYDELCGVYGKDYQYIQNVGSCYKIPPVVYTWNGAYAYCAAERAHLVVLNSEAEHHAVWNLTRVSPILNEAKASWFFFAGFRARNPEPSKPKVFLTIFNQTLEEAGYDQWSDNEPNNALNNENCGSIFKNDGKLNDLDCSHLYAFICEKEKRD